MANFNEMTSFTRGMMVVSVVLFLIGLVLMVETKGGSILIFWLPIIAYWGYRFVKDGTNIK